MYIRLAKMAIWSAFVIFFTMKASKYNFFITSGEYCYFFNAITCTFFKVLDGKVSFVKEILNNPDGFEKVVPAFVTKLYMNHFLIDGAFNELDFIKSERQKKIYEKKCKMIIMPTLGCNFRCWYCVQNHKNIKMSQDTVELIKKNIQYIVEKENIECLTLDWFGGEPFLCFKEVIEPLSVYAMDVCDRNNVAFNNTTTTNGYLLNENIVNKLGCYNFSFFQITLDGDREHHNQIKMAGKDSSFDKIIENVNLLVQRLNKAQVAIRINYDNDNITSGKIANQLDRLIPYSNRNKIKIHFRKVWQVEAFEKTKENVKKISSDLKDLGFGVETLSCPSFIPCYVSKKYQITISPDGGVYKCTAMADYLSDPLGRLGEDGKIIWKSSDFYENYISYSSIENEYCLSCKYLPLCMGKCHKSFEKAGFRTPKITCKGKPDVDYEKEILAYCMTLES